MKKILASVTTGALMGLGLVGMSTGAAQAECPYTSCFATSAVTKAPAAVSVGKKAKIKFAAAASGNVAPKGTVKVTVKKKGGGFKSTKTKAYAGGTIKVKSGKIPSRGDYVVTVKFIPAPGSIFNPSKDKDTLVAR